MLLIVYFKLIGNNIKRNELSLIGSTESRQKVVENRWKVWPSTPEGTKGLGPFFYTFNLGDKELFGRCKIVPIAYSPLNSSNISLLFEFTLGPSKGSYLKNEKGLFSGGTMILWRCYYSLLSIPICCIRVHSILEFSCLGIQA